MGVRFFVTASRAVRRHALRILERVGSVMPLLQTGIMRSSQRRQSTSSGLRSSAGARRRERCPKSTASRLRREMSH